MSVPSDTDGEISDSSEGDPGSKSRVELLLVEALIHTLLEKGVLTKNDSLDIVESVTEVTQGALHDGDRPKGEIRQALGLLERLYHSFSSLESTSVRASGENVVSLRPPLHRDAPRLPIED